MITAADLPDTDSGLSRCPARSCYRGRGLPLHIFEPRYLAMIEDCLKTKHRLIGMIQPRETPGQRKARRRKAAAGHRLRGPPDRVFRNRRRALHDHPVPAPRAFG